MTKSFIVLLAIFLIGGGLWVGTFLAQKMAAPPNLVLPSPKANTLSAATPTPEVKGANVSQPQSLNISKLNINTTIESVGKDSEEKMDVPKDADNVAWYNLGPKPGEKGNAVLAGHFDRVDGSPAVFYYLNNLEVGDELEITDGNNNKFKYKVTDKKVYPADSFPLQEVFGATDKSRLNLITCEGTFNQSAKSYSHRTVIYSELTN